MKEPEAHPSSPLQTRAEKDEAFAEDMWRFRFPEEDGEKLTYEAILVECPLRYGIVVGSLDTLTRFYAWLKLRREFREKRDAIYQIQSEMARDPDISEEKITKAGRVMFLTDSYVKKDAKVFASMVKIGQDDTALNQRQTQLDQRDREIAQREKLVEQSERRVKLLEAKAAKSDQADAVMGDGKLSEEEKAAKLKQIFRMG